MENKESPQFELFPESAPVSPEIEAEAEKIRMEAPFKHLPPDDPAIYQLAKMRAEFKKSGKSTYEYHGRNSD